MGFSPLDVDQMSYWQLLATAEGWNEAHAAAASSGNSEHDVDEIFEWMQTRPSVPLTLKRKPNGKIWDG